MTGNHQAGGSTITRPQALRFNSRWTDYDRSVVGHELDRVADRTASLYVPRTRPYVRAIDGKGRTLLYIGAGYLWWYSEIIEEMNDPPGLLEADGAGWLLPLSTHQESGSHRSPSDEETLAICSRCFIALPSTGICPTCDE